MLNKINFGISMFTIILCIILFVKVNGKVNIEETRKLKLKDVDIIGNTRLKNVDVFGMSKLENVKVTDKLQVMDKLQINTFTFAADGDSDLKLTNSISTGDVTFRIAPGSKVASDSGYTDINIQQPEYSERGNFKYGTDTEPGRCWLASRWGAACELSQTT